MIDQGIEFGDLVRILCEPFGTGIVLSIYDGEIEKEVEVKTRHGKVITSPSYLGLIKKAGDEEYREILPASMGEIFSSIP
jgi:hypothetical protein